LSDTVGSAGTTCYSPMSGITQGLQDLAQRVGDEIRPISFSIKGEIVGADSTNVVRLIVFQWKQETVPVIGDVIQTANVNSFYNHDNAGLFKILFDRRYTTSYNGNDVKQVNVNITKGFNRMVKYNATSSTQFHNGIYICLISDSASFNHPGFNLITRVRYTDA